MSVANAAATAAFIAPKPRASPSRARDRFLIRALRVIRGPRSAASALPIRFACLLVLCLLASFAPLALAAAEPVTPQLHPRATSLTGAPQGPFVRNAAGAIWGFVPTGGIVSTDEGRTWETRPFLDATRFASRPERAAHRTRTGVLVHAFLNDKERAFKWDDARGGPQEGCRLPVYLTRSTDDGATWSTPQLIQDGWCGAVRQIVELPTGRLVLISQLAQAHPARHVTLTHVSDDAGATWRAGEPIDLGAAGNYSTALKGIRGSTHGGAIEGTALVRTGGDVKLYLRTPLGGFFESTSRDGLKWTAPIPSPIEASDSPGMLARLASGRVVLAWNRFRDPVALTGRREQLSLAVSENEGVTWTIPHVIADHRTPAGAREGQHWISYPYIFEPSAGVLWISTMQGPLRIALHEADVRAPGPDAAPPRVRVLCLGDSITRGARPGVLAPATFPARVQAALRAAGLAVEVHNSGIGAERTDLALARLDRDVISQRPDIVTVMYGTNDSWVDTGKTASRLAPEVFTANLRTLVQRLRAAGSAVILMTPPRFAEENRRNGLDEDPNLRLAAYVAQIRTVARELDVPLVDHFAAWETAQQAGRRLQSWTTDGCHPNPDGHADLAPRIAAALTPLVRTATSHP